MGEFTRDPTHWLRRHSPDEWIRASLGELSRAERAWTGGNSRAGAVGLKRAAGMALNAALIAEPDPAYGRTYVEHLEALAVDSRVPEAVRVASRRVLDAQGPAIDVIRLRTPRDHAASVDAARDVIAHAWAVAKRNEAPAD